MQYLDGMAERRKTMRLQLVIEPEKWEEIDEWRWEERIEGRSEAVRRLMELGLQKARELKVEKTKRRQ